MILVDLRSGEPFVAHLVAVEMTAAFSLAMAEGVSGVRSHSGEQAARENPELHVVAPGTKSSCVPATCAKTIPICLSSERTAIRKQAFRRIVPRRIMLR